MPATKKDLVLGVEVQPLCQKALYGAVAETVADGTKRIIAHHNLHSVYLSQHDPRMQELYKRATWIYVDGMPLVWTARLLGHPYEPRHRNTCADWLWTFMAEAEAKAWRVFYLGSTQKAVTEGANRLRERFPGLSLEVADGFFEPGGAEEAFRVDQINAYRPHVLLVGMGMPRQEYWVADNFERLDANIVWTVGACIDYIAGTILTAPRWMGRMGLEWLYRLWSEPKRLWRRYLVEPWFLLGLFLRDVGRRARYGKAA